MKKVIILALSFTIVKSLSFGQEAVGGKEKKAKSSYSQFSFAKAIDLYEDLDVSELDQKRNLANSYWKTNQLIEAEKLYKEVATTEGHMADDIFNYAAILRENKKYAASDEWMKKFSEMNVSDSRGQAYANEMGAYEKLQKDRGQFKLTNLDINSPQQDFGTSYYHEKVVFASSREGTRSILRRWNWNQLPFLDIYIANTDKDQLTNPTRFSKKVNKKFHEGPVAFNAAGNMMIFTRNNYGEKAVDKVTRLQLFSSKLVDGKWSKAAALPYNSSDYSVGHATVSVDGKTIYFASDMPGGKGGVDIYKATIKEDGSFGEAINMGDEINTEGNEMFPFVHPNNEMLFFSSNGKVGLGGLDVFVAVLKEDQSIGKVMNIGAPVNSSRDDFSFVLDADQKAGYLSSNREGGKGDDDIYAVQMLKPFMFGKTIKGVVKDKNGELLASAEVTLFDLMTGGEEVVLTKADGSYEFTVEADKTFNLRGEKPKYFNGVNTADSHTDEELIITDLELEKDPGLSLYALIIDKQTSQPLDSVKITLTDNMTGTQEVIYTTESGGYLKPLMDKKLNDRGSYNIELEKSGYLGKTVTYNTAFDREGKYNVHADLDLTLDQIKEGANLADIIDINPIYFDLNKSKIRPDAALELDKIVKVMNENPTMVIELGSHTDSRGSDASNRSLSDRRAKASAKYVSERITNPDRIYGKGFGESVPNTVDASADGGSATQLLIESFINPLKAKDRKLFDKYHQFNRRTAFIIIKM
jgi:outer membrane protein OmpA-like peptidoglycan-associated protein